MGRKKKVTIPATRTIHAEKSKEVLAVEAIIKNASPLELLIRTSRGEPSITVYTAPEQDPETGEITVVYTSELAFPDSKERAGAQRDCVGYVSPRLSAIATQTVETKQQNFIPIPIVDSMDDWEKLAEESQNNLIDSMKKPVEENAGE